MKSDGRDLLSAVRICFDSDEKIIYIRHKHYFVGEDIVFPHEIYGFINNKFASAI